MLPTARSDSFIEGSLQIFNAAQAAFFFRPSFFRLSIPRFFLRRFALVFVRVASQVLIAALRPLLLNDELAPRHAPQQP